MSSFSAVGNFAARGPQNVNQTLVDILTQAASTMPGYRVEAYSGYRPGDPRFHGKGLATDLRLIGPDGKMVPNYQSAQGYRVYEQLAKNARAIQMAQHPELADKFRWGGYFWNGGPGNYGNADLMHFDLGGGRVGMGGGSWEGGPSKAMMAAYGLGGASPGATVNVASLAPTATPGQPPPQGGLGTAPAVDPASVGGMLAQATVPGWTPPAVEPVPGIDLNSVGGMMSAGLSGAGAAPAGAVGGLQPDSMEDPYGDKALQTQIAGLEQLPTAGIGAPELGARYAQAKLAGGPLGEQASAGLADLFKLKDIGQAKSLRKSSRIA